MNLKYRLLVLYRLLVILYLLGCIIAASAIKIHHFYEFPTFNYKNDDCLFYGEAAIHYHYAEMVAKGQNIPGLDRTVQYPEGLSPHKAFTLSSEYLLGFTYRYFVPSYIPFHVFVVWGICIFSSLSIIAIYLAARSLGCNYFSSLLASSIYAFSLPAMNRTIGNYLREDFTLPFIFLFFAFFMKAMEKDEFKAKWLAALGMFLALLAWHFSQFIFLLVIVWVTFAVYGFNRTEILKAFLPTAWLVILASLLMPVLRARAFFISPAILITFSLIIFYFFQKYFLTFKKRILWVFAALFIIVLIVFGLPFPGRDYAHVYSLFWYKIINLGIKPSNPMDLPLQARLFWVPPFVEPKFEDLLRYFGVLFLVGLPGLSLAGLVKKFREKISGKFLISFALIFLVLYALVERMSVFLVFFLSIGGALLWEIVSIYQNKNSVFYRKAIHYSVWLCLLAALFWNFKQTWFMNFAPPYPYRNDKDLVMWIKTHTAPEAVFLARYATSPTILQYAKRSIVLHPMFETSDIRAKNWRFVQALYNSEADLLALCQEWGADYLIYQSHMVFNDSLYADRYMSNNLALKKSAVAYLLHFRPQLLKHFQLIYQDSSYRIYKVLKSAANDQENLPPEPYYSTWDENFFGQQENEIYFADQAKRDAFERINQSADALEQAKKALDAKKIKNAELFCQLALEADPKNFENLYLMGLILEHKNQLSDASLYYEKALENNPVYFDAHLNLGILYQRMSMFEQALKQLQEAAEIKPDSALPLYNLGLLWSQLRQLDRAALFYNNALDLDPSMSEARYNLGSLMLRIGNYEDAIKQFNILKKSNQLTVEGLNNLGKAYEGLKQFENALNYYQAALKIQPNFPIAVFNIGNLYYLQNDLEQAQIYWRKFALQTSGKAEWQEYQQYIQQKLGKSN